MSEQAAPVAIVPARAGSKGLAGKNIRLLAGKPLYRHSIDTAIAAGIRRVIVSTDIPEIFSHDLPREVELVRRPKSFATDTTPMAEVLRDLLPRTGLTGHTLVLLQPTSPLRSAQTVRDALNLYQQAAGCSMVMSISEADQRVLKWGTLNGDRFVPLSNPDYCFSNRQSLPPVVRPNGAVYVLSSERFLKDGDFSAEDIRGLKIPDQEALDIDTLQDFERCAALLGEGDPI